MATPQRDMTLNEWIDFSEKLHAVENLALIGFLSLRPNIAPSIISTGEVVSEENISVAEKWLLTNFRKAFAFYCDRHKETSALLIGEALKKADVVKRLAPLLVSAYSIPLGIAVAFLFAAIDMGLDKWCEKYARKSFTGKGIYSGNFPKKIVEGFFDVKLLPAITEFVEDPEAYPLKGYKVRVKVPADISGQVKVPTSDDSNEIFSSFKSKYSHSFSFSDARAKKTLFGVVETVSQNISAGPNVLSFTPPTLVEAPLPITAREINPTEVKSEQEKPETDRDRQKKVERCVLIVKSGFAPAVYLLDKDPFLIFRQSRVSEGKSAPSNPQAILALKYIFGVLLTNKRDTPLYQNAAKGMRSHVIQTASVNSTGMVSFDVKPGEEYYVAGVFETATEEFLWTVKVVPPESLQCFLELDLSNVIR
jgi:hypothetical protein